ncbi:MAG TPA: FKBP-type peptidyl-prolyl cis-trans isomerase [Bacteroidia bacterium]|nr:FKBP-type peptidyl-prolyl cis-trans isomerase [Bacteroidia bacterium]
MKNFLLIVLSAVALLSCSESKYPGYSEVSPGIYYKLHYPGESGNTAGENDFYELRMQNKFGGNVFFDSDFLNARGTMLIQSSASKYFSVLAEGDSATFLLPGNDLRLPGMPDTGLVEMNVKVLKILKADEIQNQATTDSDLLEQLLIRRYITKHALKARPDSNGLYFIIEKEGQGEFPSKGRTIKINYTGMELNGRIFDRSPEVFTFPFGTEGQVIAGIENALKRMKPGGEAKIIIPSPLAFGNVGSTTGIIAPHTPVVYNLKLVAVE